MAVVFLLFVALLLAFALVGWNGPVRRPVHYVVRRRRPPTTVVEEIVEDRRPRQIWEEVVEDERPLAP